MTPKRKRSPDAKSFYHQVERTCSILYDTNVDYCHLIR